MRTLFVDENGNVQPPPHYGQAYYLRASTITPGPDGEMVQVCSIEPMFTPVPPQIMASLALAK